MRTKDQRILTAAVRFAAKFGFLRKDIFFEYLCPLRESQQYVYWRVLQTGGIFTTAKRDSDVLHLTPKGYLSIGASSVGRRHPYLLYHDGLVAKVFLELERTGLVQSFWTEAELLRDPGEAMSILGLASADKFPDLVVNLRGRDSHWRVAIEMETSRKSRVRYDEIALAYLRMKAIDLILVVCEDAALEAEVRRAFSGKVFQERGRTPITTTVEEFESARLRAFVRDGGRHCSLADFLCRTMMVEREVFARSRLSKSETSPALAGGDLRKENGSSRVKTV